MVVTPSPFQSPTIGVSPERPNTTARFAGPAEFEFRR
jgi:hypothetical protein